MTSENRILIMDTQATVIKVELEPSQFAKVTLSSNGFNLAVNFVGNAWNNLICSRVRRCTSLKHQDKINRCGVIILII